ncbi:hypothetical protein [Telmatospirillum sp.]|uniref:hypothetical protein n=1 Tax=Telmatospirillum sp. TaxID=2079197 RepID=UPI00284C9BC5|nr:hypothetical protein [Telmatospirillum sp.]MDR3436477.1 hypothetical protein [Telmatospirillum sp.]
MTTSIQDAIAAAETAAASTTSAAVVIDQTGSAVSTSVGLGHKITTDDVVGSVFNVEHYIKFTETGHIQIGAGTDLHKLLKVTLSLPEIAPGWGIRYGNPPIYIRTTDGVTTDRGGNWGEEVDRGRRIDPRCQPFNSWQLPFTLLEDAEPAKAGARVGYSTVWSSFKAFKDIFDKSVALYGKDATVELEISCQAVNQPGKKFGLAVFKLIGEVTQE